MSELSELSEFGIVELIRLSREELLAQLLQTQEKKPAKKRPDEMKSDAARPGESRIGPTTLRGRPPGRQQQEGRQQQQQQALQQHWKEHWTEQNWTSSQPGRKANWNWI